MINQGLAEKCVEEWNKRKRAALERIKQGEPLEPPLRKEDRELGWVYACPNCKRVMWYGDGTEKCKCGTRVCFDLPSVPYTGRVKWK